MSQEYDSFDQSSAGAYIQSPGGARGGRTQLIYTFGNFLFNDSDSDIFSIGRLNKTKTEFIGVGENVDFDETPGSVVEYKKKLYLNINETETATDMTGLAKYDNSDGTWTGVGDFTSLAIMRDMVVYSGKIAMIGDFEITGNVSDELKNIGFFDGENFSTLNPDNQSIFDSQAELRGRLEVYEGELYTNVNVIEPPLFLNHAMCKFSEDQQEWVPLTPGTVPPFTTQPLGLHSFKGLLWITNGTRELWTWDGTEFNLITTLPAGRNFRGSTDHEGELILWGWFATVEGVTANNVVSYNVDDDEWSALGEGLDNITFSSFITDMVSDNGTLYAACPFDTKDEFSNDTIRSIIKFDPTAEDPRWFSAGDISDLKSPFSRGDRMISFSGQANYEPEPTP